MNVFVPIGPCAACAMQETSGSDTGFVHTCRLPQVGWQPIETAPRDGTLFIGWDGKCRRLAQRDPDFERSLIVPGNHPWLPTHWMPLPEPPT